MRLSLAALLVCLGVGMPARADNFLIVPFFNLTGDSGLDWIGESVAETLREALASKGILALDRDARLEAYRRLSIRPYTQLTKATVMRLAEALDADQVVFGSFDLAGAEPHSKSRGSLRLTAQILNAKKLTRGPEYGEVGPLEDLARLQTHLAWETLRFVLGRGAPSEQEFRASQPQLRVAAIESYVRGLLAPEPAQQMKLFSQAVRVEPRYSQANFQLARLHYARKSYRLAADRLQRVAPADVNHRSATFLLGLCRYHLGDFAGAEQAFRSVADVVPLNEVWNNLGAAQSRTNSALALESFRRALDGDANDPDYHFNVGYALFRRGDVAAAAERFRAVLDRDPEDAEAMTMLGRCVKKVTTRNTPAPGRSEGVERLKESFEESAYLQLKAVLESGAQPRP
jgi:tetratricopeptide (TPR) repeat protein